MWFLIVLLFLISLVFYDFRESNNEKEDFNFGDKQLDVDKLANKIGIK